MYRISSKYSSVHGKASAFSSLLMIFLYCSTVVWNSVSKYFFFSLSDMKSCSWPCGASPESSPSSPVLASAAGATCGVSLANGEALDDPPAGVPKPICSDSTIGFATQQWNLIMTPQNNATNVKKSKYIFTFGSKSNLGS